MKVKITHSWIHISLLTWSAVPTRGSGAHGLRETDSICVLHCSSGPQGRVCKERNLKAHGVGVQTARGLACPLLRAGSWRPPAGTGIHFLVSTSHPRSTHPPSLCCTAPTALSFPGGRGPSDSQVNPRQSHQRFKTQRSVTPTPLAPSPLSGVGTRASSAAAGKRPRVRSSPAWATVPLSHPGAPRPPETSSALAWHLSFPQPAGPALTLFCGPAARPRASGPGSHRRLRQRYSRGRRPLSVSPHG